MQLEKLQSKQNYKILHTFFCDYLELFKVSHNYGTFELNAQTVWYNVNVSNLEWIPSKIERIVLVNSKIENEKSST